MEAQEIRTARLDKGFSQEKLAEIMGVDVTTIYRWEAGIVAPSLTNSLHLRDILSKFDGLKHPLMTFLLSQNEAIALIDREGVYRDANRVFLNYMCLESDQLIGHYATECMDFWNRYVQAEAGQAPEQLAASDIAEVTVVTDGTVSSSGRAMRHVINIVRQEQFSAVIVHRIELLAAEAKARRGIAVTRRFEQAD